MISHVVLWSFNDELTNEEKKEFAQKIKFDLENLKTSISEIESIYIEINPLNTSDSDVALFSTFKDEHAFNAYAIHPEHKKVGQFIGSIMKNRKCIDYVI